MDRKPMAYNRPDLAASLLGRQTCIENACDPKATTLEWREELKEAAGMIEQ